ncbi:MAG: methyltransferase domain-containing protein [Proteobacteria bacterium]|nr:methyltransferase domain-containing protein [Pseudomonadota bacterium]
MHTEAPYEYIRDYYSNVHRKNAADPVVAEFWLSKLANIRGDKVLNIGCGPTLYDYMLRFGSPPREYVGLDINKSTFEFLRRSRDPRLLKAKERVSELGTHTELIAADVFECDEKLAGRFDSILGVGFFATFHGSRFKQLFEIMARALRPQGMLLKLTWHGPHRTARETRKKLEYAYDNPEEPTPHELVSGIENAGFSLVEQEVLECDPRAVGWDAIQSCIFSKN